MKPSERIIELFKDKKYSASDTGYIDAIVDYLDEKYLDEQHSKDGGK